MVLSRRGLAAGLLLGAALDAVLADPRRGHPVAAFGAAASRAEAALWADSRGRGMTMVAVCLAPVAYHRLLFRQHEKGSLVQVTNVLAIAGLVTVGLAVSCAVLLVVSVVAPGAPTVVITAIAVVAFAGLWFALPLSRRDRDD